MSTVIHRLRGLLRSRHGDAAVEFISTAAMLILLVSALVTMLVYVTHFYTASYVCRRVVRTIEVTGEYDARRITELAESLGGNGMDELTISVDAPFRDGKRIQLRDEFTVRLEGSYPVSILTLGSRPLELRLPIKLRLSGRSEVFWK